MAHMTGTGIIALLFGIIMICLGVNGVRIGKVLTKAGWRTSWPAYFHRDKEPAAFWITVCIWIALGTFIIGAALARKASV